MVYSLIVLKHPDKWMKSPTDYKEYVWNLLLFFAYCLSTDKANKEKNKKI